MRRWSYRFRDSSIRLFFIWFRAYSAYGRTETLILRESSERPSLALCYPIIFSWYVAFASGQFSPDAAYHEQSYDRQCERTDS